MSGSEWGQLPNASSGIRYILIRASRYKIYRPLRNALGSCPHSDPTATYSKYDSQTYSGADINLVARLCRALIYGGRSQSSGLTQFLIRLSERSGNRTPPAELPQDPPWCYFSEHSALISSVLKTSMVHPYTIDVDTIRCGPRGDPTFRWRPQGCPRFLTCPARAAASRDRRMT